MNTQAKNEMETHKDKEKRDWKYSNLVWLWCRIFNDSILPHVIPTKTQIQRNKNESVGILPLR